MHFHVTHLMFNRVVRVQRNYLVETWNSVWFEIFRSAFGVKCYMYGKRQSRLSVKMKVNIHVQDVRLSIHQNCSNALHNLLSVVDKCGVGQILWCTLGCLNCECFHGH